MGRETGVPAIFVRTQSNITFKFSLEFSGEGVMTFSLPPYNDGWHIDVDPEVTYNRHVEKYGKKNGYPFLDYDGLRDGDFQTQTGWCIRVEEFVLHQKKTLEKLGFKEAEIEDAVYWYGRSVVDKNLSEPFLNIFPQVKEIVDSSVSLKVEPNVENIYRIWFYIVPTSEQATLQETELESIKDTEDAIVEVGYLTDAEIPEGFRRKLLVGMRDG